MDLQIPKEYWGKFVAYKSLDDLAASRLLGRFDPVASGDSPAEARKAAEALGVKDPFVFWASDDMEPVYSQVA